MTRAPLKHPFKWCVPWMDHPTIVSHTTLSPTHSRRKIHTAKNHPTHKRLLYATIRKFALRRSASSPLNTHWPSLRIAADVKSCARTRGIQKPTRVVPRLYPAASTPTPLQHWRRLRRRIPYSRNPASRLFISSECKCSTKFQLSPAVLCKRGLNITSFSSLSLK